MNVIDKIQERIDRGLYTVSVFGSSEAVYEQMWDDIESLLILFRAKNRAIENRITQTTEQIATLKDGSMKSSFELNRLRGINKTLKELL